MIEPSEESIKKATLVAGVTYTVPNDTPLGKLIQAYAQLLDEMNGKWKHNTGECPCHKTAYTQVKFYDGTYGSGHAGGWDWSITGGSADIELYRIFENNIINNDTFMYTL